MNFTPDSIVLHTAAFRPNASANDVRNWHVWPRFDEDRQQFRYMGQWYDSEGELPSAVQGKRGAGKIDNGYHIYVRKSGQVEECRPLTMQGAHCRANGMNARSIGICFEGHGDFEEWTPEQVNSFYGDVYRRLRREYGIMPDSVYGHSEFDRGKTCPGKLIDMQQVRERLRLLYTSTTSHAKTQTGNE